MKREVEIRRQFGKHPNIVNYHIAWEEGDLYYLLVELCQCSLRDMMHSGLPSDAIVNIIHDIASVLRTEINN